MSLNSWWEKPQVEVIIETPKVDLDKKINALENQIATLYWVEWSRLPQLVKFLSEKWRESLKEELKKELSRWETLVNSQVNYDALADNFEELLRLKEKLKKETKSSIEWLNTELQRNTEISSWLANPTLASKIFSKETLKRCQNPQNIWDNLVWLWVWVIETWMIAWKTVWDICVWIVKAPYDLYQIATWKAKYEWTDKA